MKHLLDKRDRPTQITTNRLFAVAQSKRPSLQSLTLQRRTRARIGDGLAHAYRTPKPVQP
ncbi:hypothetical protein SAMN04488005_2538 [Yoonia tamlensis]|uniref:Uncharacterized protein n=1 Tax=Yoonia tamlensis TaxID=390270 RepID=A0A1I6HDK7_9RHOB|nr:hypothetical protein SAMN04488005_2538 [Yoonia tamlensis]